MAVIVSCGARYVYAAAGRCGLKTAGSSLLLRPCMVLQGNLFALCCHKISFSGDVPQGLILSGVRFGKGCETLMAE